MVPPTVPTQGVVLGGRLVVMSSWPGASSRNVIKVDSTRRAPLVPLSPGLVGGVGRVPNYSAFLGSARRDSRWRGSHPCEGELSL